MSTSSVKDRETGNMLKLDYCQASGCATGQSDDVEQGMLGDEGLSHQCGLLLRVCVGRPAAQELMESSYLGVPLEHYREKKSQGCKWTGNFGTFSGAVLFPLAASQYSLHT